MMNETHARQQQGRDIFQKRRPHHLIRKQSSVSCRRSSYPDANTGTAATTFQSTFHNDHINDDDVFCGRSSFRRSGGTRFPLDDSWIDTSRTSTITNHTNNEDVAAKSDRLPSSPFLGVMVINDESSNSFVSEGTLPFIPRNKLWRTSSLMSSSNVSRSRIKFDSLISVEEEQQQTQQPKYDDLLPFHFNQIQLRLISQNYRVFYLEEENLALRKEICDRDNENEQLIHDVMDANTTIDHLKAKNNAHEEALTKLAQRVKEVEQQRDDVTEELLQLSRSLYDTSDAYLVQQRFDDYQRRTKSLIASLVSDRKELLSKLGEVVQERDDLERQLVTFISNRRSLEDNKSSIGDNFVNGTSASATDSRGPKKSAEGCASKSKRFSLPNIKRAKQFSVSLKDLSLMMQDAVFGDAATRQQQQQGRRRRRYSTRTNDAIPSDDHVLRRSLSSSRVLDLPTFILVEDDTKKDCMDYSFIVDATTSFTTAKRKRGKSWVELFDNANKAFIEAFIYPIEKDVADVPATTGTDHKATSTTPKQRESSANHCTRGERTGTAKTNGSHSLMDLTTK